MKITTRLVLLLIGSVGLVYILLQLYSSRYYAEMVEEQIKLESEALSMNAIGQIISLQKDTESTVQVASVGIKIFDPDMEGQIYDYLSQMLINNNRLGGHIFGMSLAFNPDKKNYAPYVWYKEGQLSRKNITLMQDYTSLPWYKRVAKERKPVWTAPYFEKAGGLFMVTYAYPILEEDGSLLAVLTADVSLRHLREYLQSVSGQNEYIFIISQETGVYVANPDAKKIGLSGVDDSFSDSAKKAIYQMMQGGKGSAYFDFEDKNYLVNYINIPELRWMVGVVFDADKIAGTIRILEYKNILVIIAGLFFILLVIYIVARSITKPLCFLADYVKDVGDGDLTQRVPYTEGRDEIAQLAKNFSFMQDELQKYIETERSIAAEKERIESEIRFAQEIQESFLPRDDSMANDGRFSLSSRLKAARDVGGDLYDFFFWDKDNLLLVIGDVADKGIPASLYMSMTMAFTRVLGRLVPSPAAIAAYVNNYLVRYNKNSMFVTMMTLMVNLKTGKVTIMDAGHGMLYHISEGKVSVPFIEKNIALGVSEDVEFKQSSFKIKKGDTLFLYTDGVTDAKNPDNEDFGDKRLKNVLKKISPTATADENLSKVVKQIDGFIKDAKPEDDMAMILFQF